MENDYSVIEVVKDGEIIARCYLETTNKGIGIEYDAEKGMHFNISDANKGLAKRLFKNAHERWEILKDLQKKSPSIS